MTDKKSKEMEEKDVTVTIEKFSDVRKICDFVEGDNRKSILDIVNKKILKLRGGVTAEDALKNLRAKGYKV